VKRERLGDASIALLAIIEEEFDALKTLGNFTYRCPAENYFSRSAPVDNHYELICARSDAWGNVLAGQAVCKLIEHFHPSFIILAGIAGGIIRKNDRNPIKPGDVMVVDYIHYSELKKLTNKEMEHRYIAHDHPSLLLRGSFAEPLKSSPGRWLGKIKAAPPVPTVPTVRLCNLVAGDTLLGDPESEFQQHIIERYATAVGVDMESFGVGREIFTQRRDPYYNPQFLVIRGVSDLVYAADTTPPTKEASNEDGGKKSSEENQAMRSAWRVYAAEAAAAFALTVADDLMESLK